MRGLPPVLDSIRPKIGRPEYLIRLVPTKEESVASRKIEYALYGVAVLVGVVVSTAAAAVIFAASSAGVFLTGLGLILPPFTILTITFLTFQLRNREKVVPTRLNVKVPALVVVVLLAVFLLTIAVGNGTPGPPPVVTEAIEPKPASSALAPGSYENMTLNITGSILVDAGQTIAIRNSIVTMKLSAPKSVGVWVATGGALNLDNVTLASDPSTDFYTFEVMGSASILASSIRGVWGDRQRVNLDGGLELYSSTVIVDRTQITGAVTNGILITNANPIVTNSTIQGAGDDGIEMHNSSARISGNTIARCGWAMVIDDGSSPLVQGNLFQSNGHGIVIRSSDPVIELNRFDSNSNYAIRYDETSHPVLRGNVYTLNEKNVVSEDSAVLLEICGLSTVGLAIFSLLVLFWIYKEGLRKEQLRREFGTVPPYRP
jgi:parallel beta-helix repeat protein